MDESSTGASYGSDDYGIAELDERRRQFREQEDAELRMMNARAQQEALYRFDAELSQALSTNANPTAQTIVHYNDIITNIQSLVARGPFYYAEADAERKKLQAVRDSDPQTLHQVMALERYGTPMAQTYAAVAKKIFNSEFDEIQVKPPQQPATTLGVQLGADLGHLDDYLEANFGINPANAIISGKNPHADPELRGALRTVAERVINPNKPPVIDTDTGEKKPQAPVKNTTQIAHFMTYMVNKWPGLVSTFASDVVPDGQVSRDLATIFTYINERAPNREPAYAESLFKILKTRFDRTQQFESGRMPFNLAEQASSIVSMMDKLTQRAYTQYKIKDGAIRPPTEAQMSDLVFTTTSLFTSGGPDDDLDFDNQEVQDKMFELLKLQADARSANRDLYRELVEYTGSEENAGKYIREWARSGADVTRGPLGAIFTLNRAIENDIQGSVKNPGTSGNAPETFYIPAGKALADIMGEGVKGFFQSRILTMDPKSLDKPQAYDHVVLPLLFESDGTKEGDQMVQANMNLLKGAIGDSLKQAGILIGGDVGTLVLFDAICNFGVGRVTHQGPWSTDELQTRLDRLNSETNDQKELNDDAMPTKNTREYWEVPRDLSEFLGLFLQESLFDPYDSHNDNDNVTTNELAPVRMCEALGLFEFVDPDMAKLKDSDDPADMEEYSDWAAIIATQIKDAAKALSRSLGLAGAPRPNEYAWGKAYAAADARLAAKEAHLAQNQDTEGHL